MSDTSPRPWSIHSISAKSGTTIQIIDARGGVVALMKAGGGRKADNAHLIVQAVNR